MSAPRFPKGFVEVALGGSDEEFRASCRALGLELPPAAPVSPPPPKRRDWASVVIWSLFALVMAVCLAGVLVNVYWPTLGASYQLDGKAPTIAPTPDRCGKWEPDGERLEGCQLYTLSCSAEGWGYKQHRMVCNGEVQR